MLDMNIERQPVRAACMYLLIVMCSLIGGTLFLIINARQSMDSYIDVAIIIFTPLRVWRGGGYR